MLSVVLMLACLLWGGHENTARAGLPRPPRSVPSLQAPPPGRCCRSGACTAATATTRCRSARACGARRTGAPPPVSLAARLVGGCGVTRVLSLHRGSTDEPARCGQVRLLLLDGGRREWARAHEEAVQRLPPPRRAKGFSQRAVHQPQPQYRVRLGSAFTCRLFPHTEGSGVKR